MKKVLFLHATLKFKNAINLESLILNKIPKGLFSDSRPKEEGEETLLESTLLELSELKNIDEIVLVTSDDSKDDPLEAICKALTLNKPFHCHRVSKEKEFAFKASSRISPKELWPYAFLPVYGLWHTQGFLEIAEQYQAGVACLLQADACLRVSVSRLDAIIDKYSSKGSVFRMEGLVEAKVLVGNQKFISDLQKRYNKKVELEFETKKDFEVFRTTNLFTFLEKDSGREDYHIEIGASHAFLWPLYRPVELEESITLERKDFDEINQRIDSFSVLKAASNPSFIELELLGDEGNFFPLNLFKQLSQECVETLFAINFISKSGLCSDLIPYLSFLKNKIPFVMLEVETEKLDREAIDIFGKIISQIDLIQLNTGPQTDNAVLMELIEVLTKKEIEERPLSVLRVSPSRVSQYASFKVLVDKILIKNNFDESETESLIDFSPFDLKPSVKLHTSLYLDSHGNYTVSRNLPSFEKKAEKNSEDYFLSNNLLDYRRKDVQLFAEETDSFKRDHEWFIRDIIDLFPVSFRLGKTYTKEEFQEKITTKEKAEETFVSLSEISDKVKNVFSKDAPWKYSPWRKYLMFYHEELARYFDSYFLPLGDQLMAFGSEEFALEAWERVLQSDPSNPTIHTRIDTFLSKE